MNNEYLQWALWADEEIDDEDDDPWAPLPDDDTVIIPADGDVDG